MISIDLLGSGAGKIKDAITEELMAKSAIAIDIFEEEMKAPDDSEVELSFSQSDFDKVVKIAKDVGISYETDETERSIEITDDNPDKVDEFIQALIDAGIKFDATDDSEEDGEQEDDDVEGSKSESEENSIDEIAKLRKKTKAAEKIANKKRYRQNKAKIKIKQARYRKTAKFKKLKRISKIKAKSGKTATGRRMTKRI